jgi:hypothetical protein
VELLRRLETIPRLLSAALRSQDQAEIMTRVGQVGLETNGLAEIQGGLDMPFLVSQDGAQMVVRGGPVGTILERPPQTVLRLGVITELPPRYPQQIPGMGMAVVLFQHGAIEAFGLGQLARLMQSFGGGEVSSNYSHRLPAPRRDEVGLGIANETVLHYWHAREEESKKIKKMKTTEHYNFARLAFSAAGGGGSSGSSTPNAGMGGGGPTGGGEDNLHLPGLTSLQQYLPGNNTAVAASPAANMPAIVTTAAAPSNPVLSTTLNPLPVVNNGSSPP